MSAAYLPVEMALLTDLTRLDMYNNKLQVTGEPTNQDYFAFLMDQEFFAFLTEKDSILSSVDTFCVQTMQAADSTQTCIVWNNESVHCQF